MHLSRSILAAVAVAIVPAFSAGAASMPYSFSGEIVGGDNPGYVVKSSADFVWDAACNGTTSSFCTLTITLTAETTDSGPAPSQGETLTALVFDVLGGADFRTGPPANTPWAGGSATASALEGSGAATALSENGLDVSGHWGLNPAIAVSGHGSHALSSVGDLFNGAATVGSGQMFDTTWSSTVEPSPPNGSRFGLIDSASSSGGSGWPSGSIAYVQDTVVAELLYTGTLTGVDNVEPLYGTMGLPIPEPSTALLLGLGLGGLTWASRKRHRP